MPLPSQIETVRLLKFGMTGRGRDRHGEYVPVDWRGALADVLVDHNVPAGKIIEDVNTLLSLTLYEERKR